MADTVECLGMPCTVQRDGQTVRVLLAGLPPGERMQVMIRTTVLRGLLMDNTVCVRAAGSTDTTCATAQPVAALPQTGEPPLWRTLLMALLGVLVALGVIGGALLLHRRVLV